VSARLAGAFVSLLAVGAVADASQGLQSYSRAREVLDAGIAAMGGLEALRAASPVRRRMSGSWIGSGQHPRPFPLQAPTLIAPPANGRTDLVSVADHGGSRWLEEAVESDFTGDSITRVNAVAGDTGFETLTYRREKPFHRAFSTEGARSLRVRKLRRHPEGALLMALSRPETLQWVGSGAELGRAQRVISFADPLGTRVLVYFDEETGLPTKSETLREHPIAGDSTAEILYLDYRRVGPLQLPHHVIDRTAGVPVEEVHIRSIELNAPLPEARFRAPSDFAPVEEDPAQPSVRSLGDGLYMVRGPYNVVFAAFRDHAVVLEAPLDSAYAETCLGLVRATLPGKPVQYLVSSHFHYDHVAGVRPYVAAGIPILTTHDAKGVIEQVAASRRTMRPDVLSRNPRAPRIDAVSERRVLEDGTNRIELHDFGPTDHVAQLLVAYFPRQKVLFEADVWDPLSRQLDIAGPDAVKLARKIRELGLRVDRIVPVHGIPTTIEALARGLAVREKYTR
jgi:glyoxylase-like metal-dependent hydrolase (beta-lactamase superfamily II)